MAYDYHVLLAVIGSCCGLLGYALYFRSIFLGATKPHIFTWFVYGLIDGIVFVAQLFEGGGPGAWVTLVGVVANLMVAVLSIWYGEKHITKSDWTIFTGALLAIVLWRMTSNPLLAVAIATIANTLGLVPTFRKAYMKPFEESISIWSLDVLRFGLAIPALSAITFTTVLFPIDVVIINSALAIMILIRRRTVSPS